MSRRTRFSPAALIDRAIGLLSPSRELARTRDRALTREISALAGSYEAARKTRMNRDWIPTLGSADTDILFDLNLLRARSRELVRNDGYAQVLDSIVDHVVGCGLRPHSRVNAKLLQMDPKAARAFEETADAAFLVWCDSADAAGVHDFFSLQQMVYRASLEDGEAFVRRIQLTDAQMEAWGVPYSLSYELIDPDRVISPTRQLFEKTSGTKGNTVKHGIEVDAYGRPVSYWVARQHPAERFLGGGVRYRPDDFVRVPATAMKHVFRPLRVGQTRGVPHMAPELDTFHDLDRLFEAELVTALVVACHSIFIRKHSPEDAAGLAPETTPSGQRIETLEPGIVTYLGPDEEPFAFNPNRPGNTFAPFVEILLRKMATGIGVTYEQLAKDFTKTNFSSGRQASLLAQKFFSREQARVTRQLCRPIRRELLDEAVLARDLVLAQELTPRRRFFLFHAVWAGPGYGYIDPIKEVTASKDAISAGLSTLAEECAKVGRDWHDTLEQQAREREVADNLGLTLSVFTSASGPGPATTSPEPPPDDDEEVDDDPRPGEQEVRRAA